MPNLLCYRTGQAFLRMMGRLVWGVRAEGRERIPLTGPVIIASTHESFLDPLVVGAYVPRHAWHMARTTLFLRKDGSRKGFVTWFAALFGVIEVDREGTGLGALRGAEEKLSQGGAVLIFPEGTRSTDGEVQEFRAGVGLLAIRTGAQVVPVSVDGTRRVWGRGRKAPRFGSGPVRLVYGDPVTYTKETGAKEAAADLRRRVTELRGSGAPATGPDGAKAPDGATKT